jgi:hypothetical protein
MKSILASACLALALLLTISPARADRYDRDDDDYRDAKRSVEKSWSSAKDQYYHVLELRRRYGSSWRLQRDFARAESLHNRIHDELDSRHVSLGRVRDDISDLRSVVASIRAQYESAERPRYREVPRSRYYEYRY